MVFRKGIPVAIVLIAAFLIYPKYPLVVLSVLGLILISLLLNSWDEITNIIIAKRR